MSKLIPRCSAMMTINKSGISLRYRNKSQRIAFCSLLCEAKRFKFIRQPSAHWDPVHEDINAHVKKRIPGETRVDRVKRFAREWRNVQLQLGQYRDSRGRELKHRKTFIYRYTYPNAFDEYWWPTK